MNLSKPLRAVSLFLHSLALRCRVYLPRKQCLAFVSPANPQQTGISQIYVINLDRQPNRWADVLRELACIVDSSGTPLTHRANRFSASDARSTQHDLTCLAEIDPFYSLGDQLYVEPQPHALPDDFDLVRPIRMSQAEVAIAHSHIGVWKTIAQSSAPYALVLEDDVWFERDFSRILDHAWREMKHADGEEPAFDVLYVSYAEARHGAPKELLSENVFRPERGLWFLSGYVLSRKGAQALLRLLPCRGPIDLWINHKFHVMDVRALRRPVVNQRADLLSTNSYSILPALSTLGVLDYSATALFHQRPSHYLVFAFGPPGSGLSSLALALSMLGYRCCSDFDRIPECEFKRLMAGSASPVFDAYVNVGSLNTHFHALMLRYPHAKFIVTECKGTVGDDVIEMLLGADLVRLKHNDTNPWRALCEHLRLPPPTAPYPVVQDIGQRKARAPVAGTAMNRSTKRLRYDRSPWIVEPRAGWEGINANVLEKPAQPGSVVKFEDDLTDIQSTRWVLRNDTFPGNLGLFRPTNVSANSGGGLGLAVHREPLGVRNYSAAAISSRDSFLYGRFEARLQATNVSGLVTGFFLYRSSPRQEIDIEITGNRPTRLLVNVFYNPGSEGAKFDYGYRGTPVAIPLGFDASKAPHRFAIEWDPCEIRWLVDGGLVHRRAVWNPTPIPHLPMKLHANTWPTRSRGLAGRLSVSALPASAIVHDIAVDAFKADV
ncbi:family 16 glycosylhydrolase [Bradyrhizobium sp. 190]|uniref:family 16 glycosylhydrolase n=1 Tax=Bradyrhizobium sp. 190 TaxID=2782658 RepID=UPI001FFA5CC6|nr:family 16 glycosylhydrolase [Bradyrhizobium sp. 190]MCK1513077.1 family 16 glycosylhydrolase [Bradyrhizobium sp. 190]